LSASLTSACVLIAICVLPRAASAQKWLEEYRNGNYQAAADELHPLVIRQSLMLPYSNPLPLKHLATMYAQGLGVSLDFVVACSLAQAARMGTEYAVHEYVGRADKYDALTKEADEFVLRHCAGLSAADRLAATNSMTCFAFGMPEDVLTLGSDVVRVGRGGIRLDGADADQHGTAMLDVCLQRVLRVRAVTIASPPDAAPGVRPRDFVEIIGWLLDPTPENSGLRYVLQWRLYELSGKWGGVVAHLRIDATNDWRQTTMPADFDERLTMDMIRSGHVRWRLDGLSDWVMLPDERQ
jgi:hypothetical protein